MVPKTFRFTWFLVLLLPFMGCGSSSETSTTAEVSTSPEATASEATAEAKPLTTETATDPSAESANEPTGGESAEGETEAPSAEPGDSSSDMEGESPAAETMPDGMNNETLAAVTNEQQNSSRETATITPEIITSNVPFAEGFEFEFSDEAEPDQESQDYLTQAKRAFSLGMENQAQELLLAHLVAEPEHAAKSQSYEMARWSKISRRPRWMLKIGIGINNAAVKHTGNLFPIQTDMKAPVDNKAGGGGLNMGSGVESGLTGGLSFGADPREELEQYVGLVATAVGDLFAARFAAGDFGPVFASAAASPPEDDKKTRGVRNGNAAMMDAAMMDADPSMVQPNPTTSTNDSTYVANETDGLPRFRPGLGYLGAGRPNELLEKARTALLDAYLQIDVSVSKNGKNGWVYNESSIKWILVSTGKSSGRATEKLNNATLYQAMERRGLDPGEKVRKTVAVLFSDTLELKLQPLPTFNQAMVMSRIGSLIQNPPENPLHALTEVRLYHSKGLISEEQVHLAFDLLMGEDGLTLSAGPPKSREEKLESAIPKLQSF